MCHLHSSLEDAFFKVKHKLVLDDNTASDSYPQSKKNNHIFGNFIANNYLQPIIIVITIGQHIAPIILYANIFSVLR